MARLGGDEFMLLLLGVDGAESAAKVAQKLLEALAPAAPGRRAGAAPSAPASASRCIPHDGDDAETLISNADTALYRAKEQARDNYQFYTDRHERRPRSSGWSWRAGCGKALEHGEFVVHYQPQVRLADGAVVGVEALVRWFHPDLGLVAPAEFIPLAEETGLIVRSGAGCCAPPARRSAPGRSRASPACGSRSTSPAGSSSRRTWCATSRAWSRTAAFDPADLELELTESSIMRSPEQAVAKLEALDRLGMRLSIDDFGTGYSSLGYLKRFPIQRAEDRPVLRARHHHRPERRRDRPGDHRAG